MKLSIGLFAAASAVGTDDPAFETPSPLCDNYVAASENYVNCWSPSGHFESFHVENATQPSWRQVNDGGECGFQYIDTELSLVNKTCTFAPPNLDNGSYDVGNAVFVAKGSDNGKIVGFDITGDFNYVQKWDVYFDDSDEFNYEINAYVDAVNAANKANTTLPEPFTFNKPYDCAAEVVDNWEAPSAFNCKASNEDGSAYGEYAIMFTNQHAEDKNNNYAIANYQGELGEGNTFTISIDGSCDDYGFTPHDANQATMVKIENAPADKCVYQVTIGNPSAQLFYFQGSIDVGVIDFFNGIDIQQA